MSPRPRSPLSSFFQELVLPVSIAVSIACAVVACGSDSTASDASSGPGSSVGNGGNGGNGSGGTVAGSASSSGTGGFSGSSGGRPAGGAAGALSTAGSGGSSGSSGAADNGGSAEQGGTAGGSAGTGGSEATTPPYAPCPPPGKPCIIMPLGDSITYGFDSSTGGGYRLRLLHDIWTANHDATFVGTSSSGPDQLDGKAFPKENEGHSAYTIDDAPAVGRSGISPLVPASLAKYSPHIVTLMIGTNDMGTNNDVANAPARLAKLIDTIIEARPNALLVVAQITPTGDDPLNALIRTYNAAIPDLVKSRAAAGKHVILVDMYDAFTAHAAYRTDYMNGSLHPNDTGYDVMGDTWFAALAPHL